MCTSANAMAAVCYHDARTFGYANCGAASIGPNKRRRTLPESFLWAQQQRDARAAVRVQRFWRWRRGLGVDPLTLDRQTPGCTLRVVESATCVQSFDANALARYFLHTAQFENPLTRRSLLPAEVRRLGKLVGVQLWAAVEATYAMRHRLRCWMESNDLNVLEALAGEALQRLLDASEDGEYCGGDLTEYYEALQQLGDASASRLRSTTVHHAALLARRFVESEVAESLLMAHRVELEHALGADDDCRWLLVRYFTHLRAL